MAEGRRAMTLNVERIKKQVQKAIEVAPFYVQMKREISDDDGYGGKINSRTADAYSGICLFDNSGDGAFSLIQSDAGREKEQSGPYLIVVCNGPDEILEGDFFEYNGSRYEVTKVTNVLALNIYWQVKLKEIKL